MHLTPGAPARPVCHDCPVRHASLRPAQAGRSYPQIPQIPSISKHKELLEFSNLCESACSADAPVLRRCFGVAFATQRLGRIPVGDRTGNVAAATGEGPTTRDTNRTPKTPENRKFLSSTNKELFWCFWCPFWCLWWLSSWSFPPSPHGIPPVGSDGSLALGRPDRDRIGKRRRLTILVRSVRFQ